MKRTVANDRTLDRCLLPRYYIKWPLAVLLGVWGAIFWRAPTKDDVVALIEGTSLITVLRRGLPPGHMSSDQQPTTAKTHEERHYYIDVKTCLLEHVTREPGSTYDEGAVIPIKSWSMSYTKTRPIGGTSSSDTSPSTGDITSSREPKWEVHIKSFVVNGKEVSDAPSQMSFLHTYWTTSAHTKCHVFGNSLVQRIYSDERLKDKLMESTWTTTWLHTMLIHGTHGPATFAR